MRLSTKYLACVELYTSYTSWNMLQFALPKPPGLRGSLVPIAGRGHAKISQFSANILEDRRALTKLFLFFSYIYIYICLLKHFSLVVLEVPS